MEVELCSACGEATGKAGRCEDSLYLGEEYGFDPEVGPLCEKCYDAIGLYAEYSEYPEERGVALISEERDRQMAGEGWTVEHDDEHVDGSLSQAAACYALPDSACQMGNRYETVDVSGGRGECPVWREVPHTVPKMWPKSWSCQWWNPKSRIRDLVRAGALIAAEIDRLIRQKDKNKAV